MHRWIDRIRIGLGMGVGPRPTPSAIVWIDCVSVGIADVGAASADVVIVPSWPTRAEVVAVCAREPVLMVVERYGDDRVLSSATRAASRRCQVAEVVWNRAETQVSVGRGAAPHLDADVVRLRLSVLLQF